jgi:hypothetical protein
MGSVIVVVVIVLFGVYVTVIVRHRRRGLVAERGMSIGADLGTLRDQHRVRIVEATVTGQDRVHLRFEPEDNPDPDERAPVPALSDDVKLDEGENGFEMLCEWRDAATTLAIVYPGSHLVRLRALDSLQPLTLRRVDAG